MVISTVTMPPLMTDVGDDGDDDSDDDPDGNDEGDDACCISNLPLNQRRSRRKGVPDP